MKYLGNVHYIISSDEPMWFVVGLITGVVLMAVIDFVIDRAKK